MSAPQLWPMRGGIALTAHKALSNATPIRATGIPDQLILPLAQRRLDAIPLVAVGQHVLKGELIARAGDEFGAALHASTSGTVVAIETRAIAHADRHSAPCIVLHSDGYDTWRTRAPIADFNATTAAVLIERIRAAGVVGAGGAGFPAARKLIDAAGKVVTIDTLIINGAECEPYITADDRLMRERAAEIVDGIRILQHILQPQTILIGIEDDKLDALDAMRAATVGTAFVVAAVPSVYPIGGEGSLVRVLTGREIPGDRQPSETGVLCFNVGTAAAIYRAVARDEPMLSRIVTISGTACAEPGNFDALVGTPLSLLLAQAGCDIAHDFALTAGGAMMGTPLSNTTVPITKTSHCFIADAAHERPAQSAQACIRCGYCAEVCPAALLPQQLHAYAHVDNAEQLQRHRLFDCIECGACDYICPSHIPLTQRFRDAKRALQITAFEQQQAVVAKQRFAAHQTRIARELDERAVRRQQRLHSTAAANTNMADQVPAADNKKAAIQAAIARAKAKKGSAQQPAALTALTSDEAPATRLRRRIEELRGLIATVDGDERDRLQRALADLHDHLAAAEANPNAESARANVERALAAARAREQRE